MRLRVNRANSVISRRTFVAVVTGGFLVTPLTAESQTTGRVHRVGYLTGSTIQVDDELERALDRLGWIKGRNLAIDYRSAETYERYPALAEELVRLNVEVIVAPPTAAALAAQRATRSIPIVMIFVAEPVGLGLVMSLARPGGNVTGTTLWAGWEIFRKQLQLLREVAPRTGRVAVLWNPANRPAHHLVLRSVETAARSMSIELQPEGAEGPEDFDRAFAAMRQGHAGALLVISDLVYLPHRARLAQLAIKSRLPTMFAFRWDVEAGGLMSYGPNAAEMVRRAATYVDKILRGAKPADLPVEEPTKFDLAINLKTAKALGLTIPPSLLHRTDQIIE
jgi:putative ABC transport system substrate-binding protein